MVENTKFDEVFVSYGTYRYIIIEDTVGHILQCGRIHHPQPGVAGRSGLFRGGSIRVFQTARYQISEVTLYKAGL
jgi:hypothetical protein